MLKDERAVLCVFLNVQAGIRSLSRQLDCFLSFSVFSLIAG